MKTHCTQSDSTHETFGWIPDVGVSWRQPKCADYSHPRKSHTPAKETRSLLCANTLKEREKGMGDKGLGGGKYTNLPAHTQTNVDRKGEEVHNSRNGKAWQQMITTMIMTTTTINEDDDHDDEDDEWAWWSLQQLPSTITIKSLRWTRRCWWLPSTMAIISS